VFSREQDGWFSSGLLPFQTFPDAALLARALVDGDGHIFIL
jgi:hypothetical protein